jgi:hypothetical protein
MGGQCSATHLKEEFEVVKEYEHPTLGFIKVIRSVKSNFPNKNQHSCIGESTLTYEPKDGELIAIK